MLPEHCYADPCPSGSRGVKPEQQQPITSNVMRDRSSAITSPDILALVRFPPTHSTFCPSIRSFRLRGIVSQPHVSSPLVIFTMASFTRPTLLRQAGLAKPAVRTNVVRAAAFQTSSKRPAFISPGPRKMPLSGTIQLYGNALTMIPQRKSRVEVCLTCDRRSEARLGCS